MKDIAIFGAGGYGREICCFIRQLKEQGEDWNFIGFYDDSVEKGTEVSHFGKVLGGIDELNAYPGQLAIVIAIGNPHALRGVRERIVNRNICFPNLIAPDFSISDEETFSIGEGNIIGYGCAVTCDVRIGSYNVLNADIIMGHDVSIGDFNVLMPDIRISGEVSIGNENLIGVGSIILQQLKIGNNVHLGAGSVLMTKPKDGCTYIGNPAVIFRFK